MRETAMMAALAVGMSSCARDIRDFGAAESAASGANAAAIQAALDAAATAGSGHRRGLHPH